MQVGFIIFIPIGGTKGVLYYEDIPPKRVWKRGDLREHFEERLGSSEMVI